MQLLPYLATSSMIYAVYLLNYLLMIGLPLVLASLIARKRGAGWSLFGMGAATFVASQIAHIPFNWLVLQELQLVPANNDSTFNIVALALFLGLSAGLFEESARYLTYRFWAKGARDWGDGMMLGAGHGGVEAILVGAIGLLNFVLLVGMQNGRFLNLVPDEQMPLLELQLEAMFSAPWHLVLLGAMERVFAIAVHLAMSLLVMQVFLRGQIRWLWASVLWHTMLNATAVIAITVTKNAYLTELVIGGFALLSVGIIFYFYTPKPVASAPIPPPDPPSAPPPPDLSAANDALEKSRYI